jgi:hypothetical protein
MSGSEKAEMCLHTAARLFHDEFEELAPNLQMTLLVTLATVVIKANFPADFAEITDVFAERVKLKEGLDFLEASHLLKQ